MSRNCDSNHGGFGAHKDKSKNEFNVWGSSLLLFFSYMHVLIIHQAMWLQIPFYPGVSIDRFDNYLQWSDKSYGIPFL